MQDEELQRPLILDKDVATNPSDPTPARQDSTAISKRRIRIVGTSILVTLFAGLLVLACNNNLVGHCDSTRLQGHHSHGHINYMATLKKNQQIEYAREFTAPCDYGILVFNVGPAASYLPYQYDMYQDAYVFSNNKKMCWMYPTYRGIQRGPFPWWVQGDPTSFDVETGKTPQKISNRIVRPLDAKNFTASKGGDFLIMAHHKFYTPTFYRNLKAKINSWTSEDDQDELLADDFGTLFDNLFEDQEGGDFEIVF